MVRDESDADRVRGIVAAMYEITIRGCSNHGCLFNKNKGGMHTNSICRCSRDLEIMEKGLLHYVKAT